MTAAIVACGGAAPEWHVDAGDIRAAWTPARAAESGKQARGKGRVAVCAPDEDTLTLAWGAGTRAIAASGVGPDVLDGLWWGTTRTPFAEGPSHAYLASALGLRPSARGALLGGSTHSGMDALLAAADALAAGSVSTALVVSSDALVPGLGTAFEARCGAGAAAFVLAADGPATLGAIATHARPVVDRYRGDGEDGTRDLYDARLFREEVFVPEVVEVAGSLELPDGARWALPDPDGRMGPAAARRLGGELASAGAFEALGDAGGAAPLVGLVEMLAVSGPAGLVAYGGGRTTAVAISIDSSVPGAGPVSGPATEVAYSDLLRSRRQLMPSGETVEMGLPPGGAAFVRGNPEMLGLLGARCVDCDTVSTPPSIHPHCVNCGGPKLEAVALARTGTVHTYVVNHTMPAPFEAPLALAVLDLEDGARLMVQTTTPEGVEIGAEVDLVLRRYALERGVPVYGFKARPKPTVPTSG